VQPTAILDLSASLNPLAPDPRPVVGGHLGALARYPDSGPATAALAAAMGVDPDRLLLTNGGAEGIALVGSMLGRGWVDEPDFSLYRRHLPALDPAAGRWRSNPHNPTGLLADPDERAAVWDEAFWPLATGTWTRGDAEHGAIVVGSLTKLLACPGLRAGYVLAPDVTVAHAVQERQARWSVNGLACAALGELLAAVDLPRWSAEMADLRRQLVGVLTAAGFEPFPSEANWVLVRSSRLRDDLAAQGILVRDCGSFAMPGVVRIAVPDRGGLDRLAGALQRVDPLGTGEGR
jgi:histidinol-phosphate/aromatic aminotransferase/cobyric acid decarboxylase-like protein